MKAKGEEEKREGREEKGVRKERGRKGDEVGAVGMRRQPDSGQEEGLEAKK